MSASGGKPLGHGPDKRVPGFTKDYPQSISPRRDDDVIGGRHLPRAPTILEYAPKHVRDRLDARAVEDGPPPPRPPMRDEPPERNDREEEEEQYDAPLVPDVPHDETPHDDRPHDGMQDEVRAEAAWDRDHEMADASPTPREGDDDAPAGHAPRRPADEGTFDQNLAELAVLLESIRRDNVAVVPPPPPRHVDEPPPWLSPARDELHIDGLRVPRSLAPSVVLPPPPLPAYGSSPLKIVVGTGVAALIAAALAWLIVGDWYAPAPQAAAPLLHAQAGERSAANVDPPAAPEAARGPRLASVPTYELAAAPPAPKTSTVATPPPSPPTTAPHTVTTVRVAPNFTDARAGAAPNVPPPTLAPPPPLVPPQAPPSAPPTAPQANAGAPQAASIAPQAKLTPPPPAPSARPAMDAQEIELLLKQGKDFVAVGDLVTARTVLQRVADAGVAAGAFALAETYDPTVLAKLGVRGMQGDAEQARRWYALAQELGSDEAGHRLALMARPAGTTP